MSSSAGTLFVVATPIGNLEDITLRALRVLREAHLIAAEDTRRTSKLLAHHGISTPLLSFHAHNAHHRTPRLLSELAAGKSVALVTDAGTPGVSDPGVELVASCRAADIAVDPVPGASAPLAAALASGFPMIPLTIFGFPPHRAHDRDAWFSALAATAHTVTFFEAPHRIQRTLRDAGLRLGVRPIMVARELTKLHQECLFGTASELADVYSAPKGEFTVVVSAMDISSVINEIDYTDEQIAAEFGHTTESSDLSRRAVIATVANKLRKSPKDVYAAVERVKKSRLL
jgi:16S rRNA (cytidine1402-2'-O)-methyltransferase